MKRVQIDLQDSAMTRLAALKEDTESTSYAEVVKNALRIYEFIVAQHKAKSKFIIEDKDGKQTNIVIF